MTKDDLPDEIKEMLAKIDEDIRMLNQRRKHAGLDKIPPEATEELRKSMDATFDLHDGAFFDEIRRIQEAPERKVFYIDVKDMPEEEVQAYIDKVKGEMNDTGR